jgi:hypothetical protein
MSKYLTSKEACEYFHVCRNKLMAMRKAGIIRAININPNGKRAVWRYDDCLEISGILEEDLKYLDLKRRIGI